MLEPSTRRVSIYFSLDYRCLSAIDKEITIKFGALLRPYKVDNSCGHTTDFYLGKTDLPRANSSKISQGKFISRFVLPR